MSYEVGSLAALISGESKPCGEKVIFTPISNDIREIRKYDMNADESFGAGKVFPQREARLPSHKNAHLKSKNKKSCDTQSPGAFTTRPTSDINAPRRMKGNIQRQTLNPNFDVEKESRTIFVKNVPNSLTTNKIKKIFEEYGEVESVRLRCAPLSDPRISKKVSVIKRKFHPDRTNISAFVCFKSLESVDKALAQNGRMIQDHHVLVDRATGEKSHNHKNAVFLGNVPFGAEENDLWKMFENCGKIKDIRIVRDRVTGIGKGFAYVTFENMDSVELALALNGEQLKGRELRVCRATCKPKKYKNAKGTSKGEMSEDRRQKKNMPVRKEERNGYSSKTHKQHNEINNDTNFQGEKVSTIKKKKKKMITKNELKRRAVVRALNLKNAKNIKS